MKKILVVLLSALMLEGCGSKVNEDAITVVDGDYAEMNLAAQMAKMLIEEYTEYDVEILPHMAYALSFDELKPSKVDILSSYDGSLLSTFLHIDPQEVPEDQTLYDYANEMAAPVNVKMLDKWGHQNTFVAATTQEVAAKYNLKTISDLRPVANELSFAAEHSFFEEEGTVRFKPFTKFYDLDFGKFNSIDIGLKFTGLDSGNMDVTLVNGSDGLNRKYDVFTLEDDLNFFPEYYAVYFVRMDLEDEYPGVEAALNKISGIFTEEKMMQMNYEVDVLSESPEEVMRNFLTNEGLLK